MKDVTIVLCPFNNSKEFKRVLGMVYTTTDYDFSKIEIIVVDNNTDEAIKKETLDIVAGKKEVKLIYNNNELQLAGASNLAIAIADSKHFIYLCSRHTTIYNNQWLKYMIAEMSDADYAQGVRLGGTVEWCLNGIPNHNYHAQGGIFIAFTEYMKKNKYSSTWPFSFMDVHHSADCIRQGLRIKNLPYVLSKMAPAHPEWHKENKRVQKQYIAHLHGLENLE